MVQKNSAVAFDGPTGWQLLAKSFHLRWRRNRCGQYLKILTDSDNLQVLLFLYLFSGLIALIRNARGIGAFSNSIGKYIKNERGVFYTLWALIPITFIDCGFRIVGADSIIRSLSEKNKIRNDRLALCLTIPQAR